MGDCSAVNSIYSMIFSGANHKTYQMVARGYVLIPATLCNKRSCCCYIGETKRRVNYLKTLDVIVRQATIILSGSYLRSVLVHISRSNALFKSLYFYDTGQMKFYIRFIAPPLP